MQERGAVAALTNRNGRARLAVTAAIVAAVVVVDQVTKTLAERHLSAAPTHVLGPLNLQLTYNSGAAFGLGRGFGPIIVAVAAVLVGLLVVLSRTTSTGAGVAASGLLIGGAVSNLGDRLVRSNGGAVIDFIHLSHWPTFNVADTCITVGVLLLILSGLRRS